MLVSLAVPGAALAQQALEEIVVTARKRSESLQDVPISVTAITNEQIENAGIERPADFIGLIPNVTIVDTANVGDTQVSIRGIVSTRDAESTFAYVVDGVLITNPNAFNEELVDIQQIEVLKGPQGALYGRNAVSGAILVTTKPTSEEFEGQVTAGVGNNNSQRLNAVFGGALSDNVRARVAGSYKTTDGFYENVFLGTDDSVDYLEDRTLKARLDWDVTEDLTLDFRVGSSQVDGGAINFNAVFAIPGFEAAFNQPAYFADVNDQEFIFAFNTPGENEQETFELSVKADWELPRQTLTAVFAYNDLEEYLLSDGTSASFYGYELTPACQNGRATLNNLPTGLGGAGREDLFGPFFAPFGVLPSSPDTDFTGVYGPYTPTTCDGYQYQERNQRDYSFEARLTSDESYAARWIAGLYFAEIEREVVVAYGADQGQGFLRQPYVGPTGPNPTDLLFDDIFDTKVLAGFGQVEFDLSDTVELAFAGRYDIEERTVNNRVPNVTASGLNINTLVNGVRGPINPAFAGNPGGIPERDETFRQFQPKVSLNWDVSDDINLFATYGIGFRSGGFNSIGSQATIDFWLNNNADGSNPGAAVDAQLLIRDEYEKEVTQSFELGAKAYFLDRRLRVNAALFSNNVEDNQFFEFFAGPWGLLRVVTTIDELQINGFEMDFDAALTDQWTVFGGFGLLDSEIKENANRPLSVGNDAPQAPDLTANLGANFNHTFSNNLTLNARLDYQYVGDMWFHTLQGEATPTVWQIFFGPGFTQDFSQTKRDAYSLVNLRVGLSGDRWTAAVWGRNITDEQYLQEVIPAPEFGGSFVHPSALDAYGLDFTYRF
ncbi:MAG: TonB-dependent receptor [Pseudomonadota bacterium]